MSEFALWYEKYRPETLDDYVVGQHHAKKVLSVAVYNHYKRLDSGLSVDEVALSKSNVLLNNIRYCDIVVCIQPSGSECVVIFARVLDKSITCLNQQRPETTWKLPIIRRFRDHGILLGTDGPFHNVIKIRGPMPFAESDADRVVGVFRKILNEDF